MTSTLLRYITSGALLIVAAIGWTALALAHDGKRAHSENDPQTVSLNANRHMITDQDGHRLNFEEYVSGGDSVAINFIYTSCRTVCPVLTAKFTAAQSILDTDGATGYQLISVTTDPVNDTAEILRQFAAKAGATENWHFVTGAPAEIQALLKSLGAAAGPAEQHSDFILVGNKTRGWTRYSADISPQEIARAISGGDTKRARHDDNSFYFTNLPVVDQDGVTRPFYNSYLREKVVLVNFIYTQCEDFCPAATDNLVQVRELLAKRNIPASFISISIDPETDTPEILQNYREAHAVPTDWTFLTGNKKDIDWISYRLGGYADGREAHSTVLLLGNDSSGQWRKMIAMAKPEQIAEEVAKISGSFPEERPGSFGAGDAHRGRKIFHLMAASSTVEVKLAGMPVEAVRFPCSNCHGADGNGVKEGNVSVPAISWTELSRDLATAANRRKKYNEASFTTMLRDGRRADGRTLSSVMPRYRFADQDVADLIAYLKVIAQVDEGEAGISRNAVRFGVLLPGLDRAADLRALRENLSNAAARVNNSGGIYGRQIELEFVYESDVISSSIFALIIAPGVEKSTGIAYARRLDKPLVIGAANRESDAESFFQSVIECLKGAGRRLTREKFSATLVSLAHTSQLAVINSDFGGSENESTP
jgi:protein SCO1